MAVGNLLGGIALQTVVLVALDAASASDIYLSALGAVLMKDLGSEASAGWICG